MKQVTLGARAALVLVASVAVCALAPVASFADCTPLIASRGAQDSGTMASPRCRG